MTSDRKNRFAYVPKGMSREAAAHYIGLGATKFDQMVLEGIIPHPRRAGARKIWDRDELEAAFENLPRDGEAAENPSNIVPKIL